MQRFAFRFDPRVRRPLALIGVRPATCEVVLTDRLFDVRYGPWRLQTPRENLRGACFTGPYQLIKATGPRGSMADGGVTFGTGAHGGVCVTFHEPVGALFGRRVWPHPGVTVTVEDPEGLLEALELPPC